MASFPQECTTHERHKILNTAWAGLAFPLDNNNFACSFVYYIINIWETKEQGKIYWKWIPHTL